MTILQDLSAKSREDLEALVSGLQTKLAAATKPRKATLKVTEKGGVSLYGLGRFPVTLYRGQWERLLGMREDIEAFIEANAGSLSVKD